MIYFYRRNQCTDTRRAYQPSGYSITSLNNGLIKFSGVVLFTSQDHQFIQTTANRIMEITPNGLIDKITTYDEYLESDVMARKRQVMRFNREEEPI